MNLSKIKVNASNILVKLGNFSVAKNKFFNRSLFKLLQKLVNKLSHYRLYQIKSIKDFCLSHNFEQEVLVTGRIGYSWSSASNLNGMNCQEVKKPLPDIVLSKLQHVTIASNSDYIINSQENVVANDYCAENYDFNKTYVDGITLAYWGKCCLIKYFKSQQLIPSGIMLNGKFSFNYYHNIYENLIRLLLIEDFNITIPQEIPLIIDKEILNFNSLKIIFEHFILKTKRKYIAIERNIEYKVDELYHFTSINQLTPQHINPSIQKPYDFLFDKTYIERYSKELLTLMSKNKYPKRIFISRKNIKKRNFNEDEVFEVLRPLGFVKISPETLSFEDQIALFNGADFVIGGSGAAFTNMLFSPKGCKCVIIIGRTGNPSTCFNAPAIINGAYVQYFQSPENFDKGIHENFSVDISAFSSFINGYIGSLSK